MVWETQPGASSSESPPPPADSRATLGPNAPHDCHVHMQVHIDSQFQLSIDNYAQPTTTTGAQAYRQEAGVSTAGQITRVYRQEGRRIDSRAGVLTAGRAYRLQGGISTAGHIDSQVDVSTAAY